MKAKFTGRCPARLGGILVGRDVNKLLNRWVHSACIPAEGEDFEAPDNWKWRATKQVAGGRVNTRSRVGSTRGIKPLA